MSNLDMTEAIRMLAGDRGISVDSLLQVLVEALATAYKKRPGAAEEVIVGINPENMAAYRSAGAKGFGIGSALFKPGMSSDAVHQQALRFRQAWTNLK